MRTRPLIWSLGLIIAVAVLGVSAAIATGTTPLLGLDLKGGVSVVEKPQGHVTAADLQESQQIISNRVNGLGVSNSNVTIQGNNIVIELPGAKNDTEVLKVVGQTAQLFFRPVDCIIAPYVASSSSTTTTAPNGTTTTVNPKTTTPAATKTTKSAAGPVGGAVGGPLVHLDAHLASASFPLAAGTTTVPTTTPPSTTPTTATHPLTTTAKGTQNLWAECSPAAFLFPAPWHVTRRDPGGVGPGWFHRGAASGGQRRQSRLRGRPLRARPGRDVWFDH